MKRRQLLELARKMRREPTRSEEILWDAVRGRQLCGVKFRRQQIIGQFIVDFYVSSHRLVVEIDGSVHRGREEHDLTRETYLENCGLNIVRFTADDVEKHLFDVLQKLTQELTKNSSNPPSPPAGEGARG